MKRSMKQTRRSEPYVEWRYKVWCFPAEYWLEGKPVWACVITLVGQCPTEVFEAGHDPMEAFCGALALAVQSREQFNWYNRN